MKWIFPHRNRIEVEGVFISEASSFIALIEKNPNPTAENEG